jgi:hemerythrin
MSSAKGIEMDAFRWNPCFLTGLASVDDQHHRLIELINRFGELISQQKDVATTELDSAFLSWQTMPDITLPKKKT